MRYLVTLLLAALSFNAVGQGIPQLPYNPDATEDGFIGSPDLLELLSLYGEEFSSAIFLKTKKVLLSIWGIWLTHFVTWLVITFLDFGTCQLWMTWG